VSFERTVKTTRLIVLGVLAVLVIAYFVSIVPNFRHRSEWKKTVAALQSLPHDRVEAAVQAFARDRKATDSAVPLRELVSDGYLRAQDIRGLEDRDVTVSLRADETTPAAIWIRVRAGGSDIVLLADGSIQRVTR
jgi:competence protein ComGC